MPKPPWSYLPPVVPETGWQTGNEKLLHSFAPVFVVAEGARSFNRIGTPSIRLNDGKEHVFVDPDRHAVFAANRGDRIGGENVLHLLYRIHFTKLAFKPSVFYEMHRNAGLLAIVTLSEKHLPLLLTTVYTCGCYYALLPTRHFPANALPADWPPAVKKVYGKKLPSVVPAAEPGTSRFTIHLDSRTHRVNDIRLTSSPLPGDQKPISLRRMEELENLPVQGTSGRTASFFHQSGPARGHVRGAWSPIEGLTAGLFLLDPMLGTDKQFGPAEETGTPFYTLLLPWNRRVSRLDRFEPLMKKIGFRLERL